MHKLQLYQLLFNRMKCVFLQQDQTTPIKKTFIAEGLGC